jgi:hypothetical protein
MRYAGDRMKYTKVKPKRFDNLLVISKDELEDLKKGLPIQRKGYNIMLEDVCINCGNILDEDLRKWFKQKWVNIGKKDKSGKHPECGTSGDKRGYAKCVPASKAASMSKKEKETATRRKRRAQNKAGRGGKASKGQGKKPIMVKTESYDIWSEDLKFGYTIEGILEAEYRGRKVKLGKPMRGDVKKFKVYVKNPKGNVVKVNFGQGGKAKGGTMRIRKSNPAARKSFRARHNCDSPGPRHKARYWSCRKW